LKDGVYLFETDKIYPFPMSGSVLREPKENTCIIDTTNMIQISENKYLKKNCSPNGALATYNVGLGGTWSK
jgi:hypothetical protein